MKLSEDDGTGNAGSAAVAARCESFRWGATLNDRHDLGTDVWVQLRDVNRVDLGLLIGIQVKTGPSYFEKPYRDEDGNVAGWWFSDDIRHFEAWVKHAIPHFVMLHNEESGESFWAAITYSEVTWFTATAKIQVPRANVLVREQRQAIIAEAVRIKPRFPWQGSAWDPVSIVPGDLLRHALLTPRLIAPHPNAGFSKPISPDQGIAMLVQGRMTDLGRAANEHQQVPRLSSALDSRDWRWQFFGALGEQLLNGDVDPMLKVHRAAPDPVSRAASGIVCGAILIQDGLAAEAVMLLRSVIDREDCQPVDQAWLLVQLARACTEVGTRDDARKAALAAQNAAIAHPGDVTAGAISGAATELLFSVAPWGAQDIGEVIRNTDNLASWWLTELYSWGLSEGAQRTFEAWSREKVAKFAVEDLAHRNLVAASLIAGFCGHHRSWQASAAAAAQDALIQLDRNADPDRAEAGLTALRLSGHVADLKRATQRFLLDGPVAAVRAAAAKVDLSNATRTTLRPGLVLLAEAGSVVDEITATQAVYWLVSRLEALDIVTTPYQWDLDTVTRSLDALAALVRSSDLEAQRLVLDAIIRLHGPLHILVTRHWAAVLHQVPLEAWDEDRRQAAESRADEHEETLRSALLGVAARGSRTARKRLLDEASRGQVLAVAELGGDVQELPWPVVSRMKPITVDGVKSIISLAAEGESHEFGTDWPKVLVLINVWHPRVANWNPVLQLLGTPKVRPAHKCGALDTLPYFVEKLPPRIHDRLGKIATSLAKPVGWEDPFDFGAAGNCAALAADLAESLGALDDEALARNLLTMLTGNMGERSYAARLAGRRTDGVGLGVLLVLATDPVPSVRAAAAARLARLVLDGEGGDMAFEGLLTCTADPGIEVPTRIALALERSDVKDARISAVLSRLRDHPSVIVRASVHRCLGSAELSGPEFGQRPKRSPDDDLVTIPKQAAPLR